MAEKTEPSFEEAVKDDWRAAYARDIQSMSPVQKFALKQAWDEAESSKPDSERDFARKVSRMSNNDFNALVSDVTYDAQRATSKMK
jgi:hypothetical protein